MSRKQPPFSLILFMVLLLVSCSATSCTADIPPDTTCEPFRESAAPETPANVSGALIVTDISGSMKGFVQPGSVRLFTLHDALERSVRNAVASAEPSASIKRCYLGDSLDCQTQRQLREVDSAGTYSAGESRLDLFMRKPQGGSADSQADPLDPHRLSVLITDGMQARKSEAAAGGQCLTGADPDCMAYLLQQRAEQGYGIWMALVLLPFRGTHYAERPLDDSLWQKTQQHVSELSQDQNFKGVNFNVTRQGSSVPFNSYQFEGVKPILIIALSRDLKAGRDFIQRFGDAITREGIALPAGAVYTMEMAPLSVRPRQIADISLPATATGEGVSPIPGDRQAGLYNYTIQCERNATTPLTVSLQEKDGIQMIPQGVDVTFNLAPEGENKQLQSVLTMKAMQEKGFDVQLSCEPLGPGHYMNCLNLQAELKINPQANTFWRALSADNMYEAPERVYGLRDMIQKVLEAVTKKPRITDRVAFAIERR